MSRALLMWKNGNTTMVDVPDDRVPRDIYLRRNAQAQCSPTQMPQVWQESVRFVYVACEPLMYEEEGYDSK